MAFSPAMLLADLDYIAPAQECVKPELIRKQRQQQREKAGLVHDGSAPPLEDEGPEDVKITLQDCLACSGCVTTAETLLVTSQSRPQIESVLAGTDEVTPRPWSVVVSISDQSAASLAAHLGVPMVEAFAIVSGFARNHLGAQYVADTRWAQRLAIQQTTAELLQRINNTGNGPLPLIVSSCPGWVCYVEKSHPGVLPHLSTVMSPQAIVGRYIKQYVAASCVSRPPAGGEEEEEAEQNADPAARTYHISVQPCFDRKLEAARGDYASEAYGRDTDCVLGTQELLDWMMEVDDSIPWRAELDSRLEPLRSPEAACEALTLEGSGGYHQHALAEAAALCAGADAPPPRSILQYQHKRNANYRIVSVPEVVVPATSKPLLGGIAYGFQHTQNLVRGLKRKAEGKSAPNLPDLAFMEVMACPDGCLNGGGQIRTADRLQQYQRLQTVQAEFESFSAQAAETPQPSPEEVGQCPLFSTAAAITHWIGGAPGSDQSFHMLHTQLHDRQAEMQLQDSVAVSLRW